VEIRLALCADDKALDPSDAAIELGWKGRKGETDVPRERVARSAVSGALLGVDSPSLATSDHIH
jgi:hypothetical protein